MIPHAITLDHILRAIEQITRDSVPANRESRDYDLVLDDGRRFPPKYVIAVASKIATGEWLGSEAFGGGEETNGFLRARGFRVESKLGTPDSGPVIPAAAPPRPRPPNAPRMRVARAILNMGVTPAELRGLAHPPDHKLWPAHRETVRAQLRRDPAAYGRRLVGLATRARAEGADILVLPACALVHEDSVSGAVEAAFSTIPYVLTGCLELRGDAHREYSEIRSAGRVIDSFNDETVRWLNTGAVNLFVAQSSTISLVGYTGMVRSGAHPPNPAQPALVLDMGHHQYGGRYLRLLEGVRRRASALCTGQRAVVALAYWKYRDTEPVSGWCRPEESWIASTRHRMPWPASDASGPCDLLDVLDIDFAG